MVTTTKRSKMSQKTSFFRWLENRANKIGKEANIQFILTILTENQFNFLEIVDSMTPFLFDFFF